MKNTLKIILVFSWNHKNSLIYESKSLIQISSDQKGSTVVPIKNEFIEMFCA